MLPEVIFHLAFPVDDLQKAKQFYKQLGATIGRESPYSFIMDFYGNQLVAHKSMQIRQNGIYPRHFGLVLKSKEYWQKIADDAARCNLLFFDKPRLRFKGLVTEHSTFFLQDPSGNLLEFKHYTNESAIFGEHDINEVGETHAA